MFVNFAKEQTDEDDLTEVVVSNTKVQTNLTALPARTNIQPQPPITSPLLSKNPQQHGNSSDGKPKEGRSKKAKASKVKSKEAKADREKSSSTAMTTMRPPEETHQGTCRGSSESNSTNGGLLEESSESKEKSESCRKDPTALFMVNHTSQYTAL